MRHEDKHNITGDIESLSSDERNVSRLLSNMKRVDTPKDFDFRLKARIANASPGEHQPVRLFPVLKYALPLALFLMIGAAFVLTNSYDVMDVPEVTTGSNASAPASDPELVPQAQGNSVPIRQPGEVFTAANPRQVERPSGSDSRLELVEPLKRSNNSIDRTIRNAADTRGPRFGNSNSNSPKPVVRIGPSIPLQFRQVLMSLGIDASDAGEKTWKVMKLSKDGIAERSGLQVGDVMEAIDDKAIDSLYDDSFSVKSINVRRGGEVVKINIRPNKP